MFEEKGERKRGVEPASFRLPVESALPPGQAGSLRLTEETEVQYVTMDFVVAWLNSFWSSGFTLQDFIFFQEKTLSCWRSYYMLWFILPSNG